MKLFSLFTQFYLDMTGPANLPCCERYLEAAGVHTTRCSACWEDEQRGRATW